MTLYLDGADRDRLDPILDACVAIYKEQLDEDGQVDFKGKAFMRTYGFLASILPYTNTALGEALDLLELPPSHGKGSHIDPAHCRRSCRRPRSSSSLAACGPAASSAKVMAEIAVVSGSPSLSITSRSITTDVSSRPHESVGQTSTCWSTNEPMGRHRFQLPECRYGSRLYAGPLEHRAQMAGALDRSAT